MFLRVGSYFQFTLLACGVYVSILDVQVGICYLLAILPLILFTSSFFKTPKEHVSIFFVAAGSIWVSYLVRPMLLVSAPDLFLYNNIGAISVYDHCRALLQIAVLSTVFLSGLYLVLHRGRNAARNQPCNQVKISLLLRNKQVIMLGVLFVALLDLCLLATANIGVLGTYSPWGFVTLFFPTGLVVPIAAVYIIEYRGELKRPYRWLAYSIVGLCALTSLLKGSKAALINVVAVFVVLYLFRKGNIKLSTRKVLVTASAIVLLVLVTFPVATSVRYYSMANSLSFDILQSVLTSFDFADGGLLVNLIDMSTRRFCGYDGIIAVNLFIPPELHNIFAVPNMISHVFASLVPGYSVEEMNMGKAVGVFYTGHPVDVLHAGALGLFASTMLIGGNLSLSCFQVLTIGIAFGFCFRIAMRLQRHDAKMVILALASMQLVIWMMSGNLDILLSSAIITLVHIVFYYSLFYVPYEAALHFKAERCAGEDKYLSPDPCRSPET